MSALVPVDGRVFWTGAHADIGAGALADWARDTDYDDRFLQGGAAGFTVAANGGEVEHDHDADPHGLTGNPHTHTVSGAAAEADDVSVTDGGEFAVPRVVIEFFNVHTHGSSTSSSATITYQNSTATINTDNTSPPAIRAIVIKPDGAEADIPDDAICFTDETAAPTGFSITDGGGTTDDLDGRFIRAPDTGNDGDVAGEGAATHLHVSPVDTHTIIAHSHAAAASGAGSPSWGSTAGATQVSTLTHHNVVLAAQGLSDLTSNAATVNAASTEPAYVELLGIQNTSGAAITPEGVIIGYVGTEASIPLGWELVSDTTDKQIKITTTVGTIGDTGGSDTHTHTTVPHPHTHTGGHIHTGTGATFNTTTRGTGGSTVNAITTPGAHTHAWTIGSTVPTAQNNTFTMSTDDGRLPYRTMIFIKRVPWTTVHIKGGRILGGRIL